MMAKYPLGPLLSARLFREDAAAREARLALRKVEEAKEAAEAARREWLAYREWRPGEEVRLFETVRGKPMPLAGLDSHRDDIQALRARELRLEDLFHEAEEAIRAAEKAAEAARERHAETVKERRKIEEHREIWLRAEAKRQEAAEEAELEDFAVHSPEDGGEDGAEDMNDAY